MNTDYDFAMERKLRELDPELHKRFTESVFGLQNILSNYMLIFPTFTDHTELHSMNVIDFCNQIIGSQLENLNADEIYSLLMGCYFHDTGMGIREKDSRNFRSRLISAIILKLTAATLSPILSATSTTSFRDYSYKNTRDFSIYLRKTI